MPNRILLARGNEVRGKQDKMVEGNLANLAIDLMGGKRRAEKNPARP